MSISEMKEYINLCLAGESTIPERKTIIRRGGLIFLDFCNLYIFTRKGNAILYDFLDSTVLHICIIVLILNLPESICSKLLHLLFFQIGFLLKLHNDSRILFLSRGHGNIVSSVSGFSV